MEVSDESEGHVEKNESSLPRETIERLFTFPGDDEHRKVIHELNDQTHRGLAVLGSAYLEWKLREAIKSQLPLWDDIADGLFGTADSTGAFRLGHQARIAYCFRLIGKVALSDIESISEIRNRFAHRLLVRSFDSEKIRDKCLQLKTIDTIPVLAGTQFSNSMKNAPRGRFLVTIHFLGILISSSAHKYLAHAAKSKETQPEPPDMFW